MLNFSKNDMNSGEIEIEHPAQPERSVVGSLLLVIVMSNAEVVRDVEQVLVICGREQSLNFRP